MVQKMNTKDHQDLVDVIRGVHHKLRKALYSSGDPNTVWAEHLKEWDLRKKYSFAMHKLATEAWNGGKECRIEWTYKTCLAYFYGGGLEQSLKRQMKLKAISLDRKRTCLSSEEEDAIEQHNYKNFSGKLKLLDVGSCYNPFSKYEEFICFGIDLTPATDDVLQCDYLNLEVKSCKSGDKQHYLFCEENFDVVVLSLLLEYLPSTNQRLLACYKSWQLLQQNGLCIIITPDSKSVQHNAPMMKSWKLALEKIGFVRVKYDKLQHLHCMAFRKLRKVTEFCWNSASELLYIPQDFKEYAEEETIKHRTIEECADVAIHFEELPLDKLLW